MTQNVVTLDTLGGQVLVCVGWDRPLQQYFCTAMELHDIPEGEEEAEAWISLPFMFPGGLDQIRSVLAENSLGVPSVMLTKTQEDGENNRGNVIRVFSPDGTLLEENGLS